MATFAELQPLEEGTLVLPPGFKQPPTKNQYYSTKKTCFKGPLKALRLFLFITVIPGLFIFIPIYMRYRVFPGQMYPVGMTDMRLIDSKISTTWCQKQVVKSNAMFNAYLVKEQPTISSELVPVSMTRYLQLEDDMKEYWGFYLLKGSVVTVSTCVRRPGASIIVIRGYKHLRDCAYIGDDSSEELDELIEANDKGLLDKETQQRLMDMLKMKDDSPANQPENMRRSKSGVDFHDKSLSKQNETNQMITHDETANPNADITDHDPKELKAILDRLHSRRAPQKASGRPDHLVTLQALHRHRDANVDKEAQNYLHFEDLDGRGDFLSSEIEPESKTVVENPENSESIATRNDLFENAVSAENYDKDIINPFEHKRKGVLMRKSNENDAKEDIAATLNVNKAGQTSKEVLEDVYQRLDSLGESGKRILDQLNQRMKDTSSTEEDTGEPSEAMDEAESNKRLDELMKIFTEAIEEERRRNLRREARRKANESGRIKRQLMIQQAEMTKEFNEDDEKGNAAIEEDMTPDGFADQHGIVNETTPNDMSNSEFWSSFSSSEEALLECEGLLLNLALTPHPSCEMNGTETEHERAAHTNAFTYKIPANGYYFFVLNSENEVQTNFIRVKFDLQKTVYEVAQKTIVECRNYTEKCYLPLDIFSGQKVVLEVPLRNNDSLWNEEFVVYSECEPRTSLYIICVIAVPLIIILFAFQ